MTSFPKTSFPTGEAALALIPQVTQVRLGVTVAIFDARDRLLLEKRRDCGLWGFVGGRVDPGESVSEAARREANEETGLTIELGEIVGVYSRPSDHIAVYPDAVIQLAQVLVKAKIIGGTLQCSDESETLEFFDLSQIPTELVPRVGRMINDLAAGRSGILD